MDFATLAGTVLREHRNRRGMTLRDVSRESGGILKPSSVAGYERGERAISLARFVYLTGVLGVAPEQLLSEIMARISGEAQPDIVIDLTEFDGLEGLVSALRVSAPRNESLIQTT